MPKVLLVDDDQSMTSLLKTLLELEPDQFDVHVAAQGQHALKLAQADPPDLIMLDYHLKDMDGVSLITQFRKQERFARIPIVMASGLDVKREALSAGADIFLLKPFEPSELPGLFLDLMRR